MDTTAASTRETEFHTSVEPESSPAERESPQSEGGQATTPAWRSRIMRDIMNFKFIGIICLFLLLLPVCIAALTYLTDKWSHNEEPEERNEEDAEKKFMTNIFD